MRGSKSTVWFWIFVLPVIIALAIVVVIPFTMGIYYSFTNWNGIVKAQFVGLTNFAQILKDGIFFQNMAFTAGYSVVAVISINVIGLGLALLVTQKMRAENLYRTIFFMPNLIGGLILGFIWQFIFLEIFPAMGFENWLTDTFTGFMGILIVSSWQMSGYIMVIYIAYLQNIPSELLEAADMDGVNAWQKFKNIIFPLVAPGFTVSMFLTLSNSFKMYDLNLALTNGGPGNTTRMVAKNIVDTAYADNHLAYGQAKAVIFFIVIAAISLTQAYYNKKREVEM